MHRTILKRPHVSSAPGVYIFKRGGTPVYIGKAANLKKRLSSYFRARVSDKVRRLREEATRVEWSETASDIEALIQEAILIKCYIPKYNVLMRDDKSYFYVAITREKFPRIFVTHEPHPSTIGGSTSDGRRDDKKLPRRVIGPFTSGSALFATLKLLRRVFPYCTCKQLHKRSCLNAQIGRCPGFCCIKSIASDAESHYSLIRTNKRIVEGDVERYRENIRGVSAVLRGRRKRLLSQLKREMREASRQQEFEQAAKLRDQIEGLENIFAHRRVLEVRLPAGSRTSQIRAWPPIERKIQTLLNTDIHIRRVEGYDISNVSGTHATGSMVVFINGFPAKSAYKKFKIKTVHQANDVAMHREMMRRRLAHAEWPYPDLMVMDGGKPQRSAAIAALRESRINNQQLGGINIVALAKREEELYVEGRTQPVRLDSLPRETMLFFQHVRDESHRFAKKYHHKLREMALRGHGIPTARS